MARKPQPGGDRNAWGLVMNEFLDTAHNPDGTIKPAGVQTAVATEVETALSVQLPPAVVDAVAADSTVTAAAAAAIDAEPRISDLMDAKARVDPGVAAPKAGAVVAQGIMGPVWQQGPVSADWYSNLNDAITTAGVGGRVVLSPGVEYVQSNPLLVLDNLTIEGDSRYGSVIKYTGAAAIQSSGPTTVAVNGFRISNVTLHGDNVGGMGIDARGFSECHFDMVTIWNPTSHGIWFGGQNDLGGWRNTFSRGEIRAPLNGAAVYIQGRGAGGTGASSGNQIVVKASTLYNREASTSYSVNVEEGEGNTFLANDMGYGVDSGAAIRIGGALAARNRFISTRTENVKRAVVINGGEHNMFLASSFGLYSNTEFHGAEIYGGHRNVFRDNWWDVKGLNPSVWEDAGPGAYQTIIDDTTSSYGTVYGNTRTSPQGEVRTLTGAGSLAAASRASGDSQPRFIQQADGKMLFGSGSAAPDATLERLSASTLATGTGDKMIARGGLGSSNLVAVTGTLGTMIRRMPIYDETGTFIGYIPVYDAIT